MFENAELASGLLSPVEEQLRAVLESLEFCVSDPQRSGPLPDLIDVPLREAASSAPERPPSGRTWLLEEGAAHREGPKTELGRLLERGVAHLERAHAVDRQMARAAADRARALAAFARLRPAAAFDRAPGETGAASAASRAARPPALEAVSEWAADEVAAKLSLSPAEATGLLTDCLVLVGQLPATLGALEEGRIGWAHARVLAELLAPVSSEKRARIEALVLARADGKSRTQLRVATRRVILREDAAAAVERAAAAIRERDVRMYPGEDGMATLSVTLPVPVARACLRALEEAAEACVTAGEERTKAQRMADCFTDLVLRPGSNGLPPVQVQLTLVAAVNTLLGGNQPGEVDGEVVPAALVRELAYTLGLLPRPQAAVDGESAAAEPAAGECAGGECAGGEFANSEPADAQSASGESAGIEPTHGEPADPRSAAGEPADSNPAASEPAEAAPGHDRPRLADTKNAPGGAADTRKGLADLLSTWRTAGTALAGRPRIAIVDEFNGALLALTDAVGLRSGKGLGPPPESPGYRPLTELDRFVRLRDRRCRFPGCRARPTKCDLDHTCPWPCGPTSHDNLCCLCQHHHRLSHQAPGWRLWAEEDGGLTWRTPSGDTLTTYPPAFGTDAHLPIADAPVTAVRRPVQSSPAAEEDPPPF